MARRHRRKRCPFCGELFWPDLRVRHRQWACSEAECQRLRRQETQRRYRESHPPDKLAQRLCRELALAKADGPRPPPKHGPMARFPWDEVRDEIAPQLLVILAVIGTYVFRAGRDETSSQVLALKSEMDRLASPPREDVIGARSPPS